MPCKQCRETNRLIIGLLSWAGFKQTGIAVQHGKRFSGETKYTLSKQIRLAVTSILAFSDFPLRMVVYLGLFVSLIFVHLSPPSLSSRRGAVRPWRNRLAFVDDGNLVPGWHSVAVAGSHRAVRRAGLHRVQRRPMYILAENLDRRSENACA